jgi:hypothetical protein
MEPTQQLIDDIYREKVLRARRSSPGQKICDGPELFDWACEWMTAGIRNQHPNADDSRVRAIVEQRLALRRRLENPM